MPHSKKLGTRPGMVLTEALVAISTLAMGVIALGTITQNAIGTTILAKDYLVARGLAKEGEEVVKNIRYTNWMLKPADKNCWLRMDVAADCSVTPIKDDYFVASLNENGSWILTDEGAHGADPDDVESPFRLHVDKDGYYPVAKNGVTTPSRFFRSIQLTDLAADNSSATFNTKVQWKDGAKTLEINRSLTMYNYL